MTAPLTPTERKRLADLLGRLGSDHPGERDNAGVMAHRLIKTRGLTWPEILDPAPPVERSSPEVGTWRSACLELQKRSGSSIAVLIPGIDERTIAAAIPNNDVDWENAHRKKIEERWSVFLAGSTS